MKIVNYYVTILWGALECISKSLWSLTTFFLPFTIVLWVTEAGNKTTYLTIFLFPLTIIYLIYLKQIRLFIKEKLKDMFEAESTSGERQLNIFISLISIFTLYISSQLLFKHYGYYVSLLEIALLTTYILVFLIVNLKSITNSSLLFFCAKLTVDKPEYLINTEEEYMWLISKVNNLTTLSYVSETILQNGKMEQFAKIVKYAKENNYDAVLNFDSKGYEKYGYRFYKELQRLEYFTDSNVKLDFIKTYNALINFLEANDKDSVKNILQEMLDTDNNLTKIIIESDNSIKRNEKILLTQLILEFELSKEPKKQKIRVIKV